LLEAVHLPGDITVEPMGSVILRGHDLPTELFALSRA
jgi:hypothetical protein